MGTNEILIIILTASFLTMFIVGSRA